MVMSSTISASEFKARCLALLDEVAQRGEEIIVTKRGVPVARVSSLRPPPPLEGSVTFNVADEELLAPIDVRWSVAEG